MKETESRKNITPSVRKNTRCSWTRMEVGETKAKNDTSIRCLKVAQKSIYVLVLFTLSLILLVQIFDCVNHYLNEPTYVETKVVPQNKALFPAMTICPQSNGYNEDTLKVFI